MVAERYIDPEMIQIADKIVVQPNVAGIFWDYVSDAFERRKMAEDIALQGYLVELLGRFFC